MSLVFRLISKQFQLHGRDSNKGTTTHVVGIVNEGRTALTSGSTVGYKLYDMNDQGVALPLRSKLLEACGFSAKSPKWESARAPRSS